MDSDESFDAAIIGAGVFGAWTAHQLKLSGADVVLLDAYGPGNSRASSGGESRIIRMGYGPDEIYTRMAQRSLLLWQKLFAEVSEPGLFQPTGVLWLARENDLYCEAMLRTFEECGVRHHVFDRSALKQRYPQLDPGPVAWGILEPESGVLMARRAVQAVVAQAQANGVTYIEEAIVSPQEDEQLEARPLAETVPQTTARLSSLITRSGRRIFADKFVFACGPWLPQIFPELLGDLIHVTRQEVFFFGVPTDAAKGFGPAQMPAWIDFNDLVYGIPNLDQRGFKIAIDEHGPAFDPEMSDRLVSEGSVGAVRSYLGQRMPALANAPVTETRVCQYENTSNGDFLIDRHPAFGNVWLVGGGSGHGFKHGPAIGEQVAALISGDAQVEPRFALTSKEKVQSRKVY